MPAGTYPGRLTREQWLRRSMMERHVLIARAESDLLDLWKTCGRKSCRRAHACGGDEKCRLRPYLADFNNKNFGRPDYVFRFKYPAHLKLPRDIINQLPFWQPPPAPEVLVRECAAEAGSAAGAALSRIFGLRPRRRRRPAK